MAEAFAGEGDFCIAGGVVIVGVILYPPLVPGRDGVSDFGVSGQDGLLVSGEVGWANVGLRAGAGL